MKLIYSAIAKDQITSLPPQTKGQIRALLEEIQDNPHHGKALRDDLTGFRSSAFHRYRIVYRIMKKSNEIWIYIVERRETVYENASRLLAEQKKRT
ncbi:MAG: hypothetical protein ACD_62C00350G0003 [uncultured bacterium]|nr:MAG: hypothetical protein ACD_62C00350G0003 [uncultured bacterium]